MAKKKVTYDLVRGHLGADVARLQKVLNAALDLELVADGVYGVNTFKAIQALQTKHGLGVDGQCAGATLTKVRDLGYDAVVYETGDGNETASWPAKPPASKLPQPTAAITLAMFGEFAFEHTPTTDNPEKIRILGNWEAANIVSPTIPQLKGVPIPISTAHATPSSGKIRCHKLAQDKLKQLFAAWDSAGLTNRILTYDGAFNARLKRGKKVAIPANLSNHSWGATIDINADLNPMGNIPALMGRRGCVRELAVIARDFGIYWGGHFSNSDGMHFEVAKLD